MRAWRTMFAIVATLFAVEARPARACGGTFCDPGPTITVAAGPPATVDQSGENVLFVMDGDHVEAHVQIRYQGDPARFAWLVPMPAVPEVRVGSQPLFDALLAGSSPVFGIRTTRTYCDGSSDTSESTGCGGSDEGSAAYGGLADDDEEGAASIEDPIGRTVGSYDVTILRPKNAAEVLKWLMDNDFQLPERSEELIGPYAEDGAVFVAIRLVPGADVNEIHPIVFRYPGTRPMIPIRLTAVAATDDMRVRVFFLGDGRVVPSSYRHVEPNAARLNWPGFGDNYEALVANAVDETGDGLGFVTEYAGPSSVVDTSGVLDLRWDADVFASIDPLDLVDELTRQGLVECSGGLCLFRHPLLLPLLQRYLPAPAGTDENAFYGCLHCSDARVDLSRWDGAAFARDFDERIVEPGRHALALLQMHAYLTRLLTFISPEEMTADPVFHERADLPPVPRERWAEQMVACDEPIRFRLPDGREILLSGELSWASSWPAGSTDMPPAETIEMIGTTGAPRVVASFSAEIDARIEKLNASQSGGRAAESSAKSAIGCRVGSGVGRHGPILAALAFLLLRRRWLLGG